VKIKGIQIYFLLDLGRWTQHVAHLGRRRKRRIGIRKDQRLIRLTGTPAARQEGEWPYTPSDHLRSASNNS
jgi:hypothetical protein